jgi:apolipoprotein N-acyltransferase
MFVVALPARFPLRFLIALVLGGLHAASFIDDATWPLEIATLAGLVALAIRAERDAEGTRGWFRAAAAGARTGFGFGLGWFLVGVSWIYISLHTYGGLSAPLAGAAIVAFCAYLAIYPTLACAGFVAFRHRRRPDGVRRDIASVLVFAALWALSEVARGYVFTGFPWLASGYAHVGGPLAGYAPIVGVYGVSMIAAAIGAVIAFAARRGARSRGGRSSMLAFTVLMLFGLPLIGSAIATFEWTVPYGKPIEVRLLQGNVPQDVKFEPAHFDATNEAYLDAIEAKRADLIVLPETAFPVFLTDLPEAIGERLAHDARTMPADIAFGIPVDERGDHYFNSVIALSPSKDRTPDDRESDDLEHVVSQRYSKSHLVPFGEFVPTGFHWFVRLLRIPLGDFDRGSREQKPMTLAGLRIAFDICYEDLFGEEIIVQAKDANVLVNVSNVAWFGDSMALPQHLDISRMRSIETGRPMLRATNTGMTASIDPHGRVLAVLKPFTVGSLDVTVQGMTGSTPYLRHGNASVLLLIVLCLASAFAMTRRRASPEARTDDPDVIEMR